MRSALIALLILCFGALAQAADRGPALAGRWQWVAAIGTAEFHPDGSGSDSAGHTVRWSLSDPARRVYTLRWSHGYTDTGTLAEDGRSLAIVNNEGFRFTATRIGAPARPPEPRGLTLAGRWQWVAAIGTAEFHPDGSGSDSAGHTVRWSLSDPARRIYTLRWSHGYTDTGTLAEDGRSLAIVNNEGFRFTATRIGEPARPPEPRGLTLAGRWQWVPAIGTAEFHPDGTGSDSAGHTVRWSLSDPARRIYTLRWSHGYTDTGTLSDDGRSLAIVNNEGFRFTATRIGEPARSPEIRGLSMAGRWQWVAAIGTAEFHPDGTGSDSAGHTVRWSLSDPARRIYTLRWSHGYTDSGTLSEDGRSLAIVNNEGFRFTASRLP
jgi:hypothetical protein